MQKLEKNLVYIKKFFINIYMSYSGIVFCLVLAWVVVEYYESFLDYAFTPPKPMMLIEYYESQHWVWKAFINRYMYRKPPTHNNNWMIGADYNNFFYNMSNHEDPRKWYIYDKCHFWTTLARMEYTWMGSTADHPSLGIKKWKGKSTGLNEGEPIRVYLEKIYKYSKRDMGSIWPTVQDDEWELMLLHKWYHNVFQFPVYWIVVLLIDPIIDFFFGSAFRYLVEIDLKEDFIYRLTEYTGISFFIYPIAKFVTSAKNFFDYIFCDSFPADFRHFLYNFFFSTIANIFYICKVYFGILHYYWNSAFYNFSINSILYFFSYCFINEYILYIFSFLVSNFFTLFRLTFFLNCDLEFTFLKNIFFIFFSYFFVIFLFYTIFSKYFWKSFGLFLGWLSYIWFDIISIIIIISTLKIISIISFLPFALWKFFLKKCLSEETVKKFVAFLRWSRNKYFWYTQLILDIYLGKC